MLMPSPETATCDERAAARKAWLRTPRQSQDRPGREPVSGATRIEAGSACQPITAAAIRQKALVLQALAVPARLKIVVALGQGERSVGDLVRQVGSSQPGVSMHLKVLQAAAIVERRRCGQFVYYRMASGPWARWCRVVCQMFLGHAATGLHDGDEDRWRRSARREDKGSH